jgi:predicted MFS family arabinose efflux permease
MIVCDAGRALVTGSVPLAMATHHLTLLQLYLVSLIGGTLYVFYSLAQTACLPRVVAPEHFSAAMALNEAVFSLSLLLGPALAGVLWSIGHTLPFLVDAVSYAGSVISLCFMRMSFQEERTCPTAPLWAQIAEGLRWLWGQRLIRFVSLVTGVYNFLTPGVTLILIVVAQGQHISSRALGVMLAMAGVGGLLGALACPWLQRRLPFAVVIRWSCVLLALVWPLFTLAPSVFSLAIVLAVFSALDTIYSVVQYTYRLARIPDALQGRVNSIVRLLFNSLQTLGLALTGVLLERLGPQGTIVLYAGGFALAALAVVCSRVVRAAPAGDAARERLAA